MKNLNQLKFSFLTIALLGVSVFLFAQPGNPSTPTPFGFLEMLLGAGMVYGGYKHSRRKKQ